MRKALVVGINNYPRNPLKGCVNDANSVANVLETDSDGSPNFHVVRLVGPPETIDKATLNGAISKVFEGDSDVSLLYFSGHGAFDKSGTFLVPVDAQRHDLGVSLDSILALANKSQAKNRIIILDCCHSGAAGTPATTEASASQLVEGVTVLAASRSDETALEVNGSGVFTNLLVSALQGGAADICGNITPGSVYAYVDQALGPWDQRPIFKTNVSRFVSLRKITPRFPISTLRKITEYFPTPHDDHKLDPSYEDTIGPSERNPQAVPEKVTIFKDLQKFVSVGLVKPVGEDHMYFAAINSKSCQLTALGHHYWRLVSNKLI